MNIEPISSVMTLQTQNIPAAKPVAPVEAPEDFNAASTNPSNKIDATTQIVEDTASKGDPNAELSNQERPASTNEQIKKAIETMNKNMINNSEAIFGFHEGTNRVTIKIVDKDTKKVIKELPPEKTLDMIAKVWEMAGILVDEKR